VKRLHPKRTDRNVCATVREERRELDERKRLAAEEDFFALEHFHG
jgi:hypothetical protein